MVEPYDTTEFHNFRVLVARMTGDDPLDKEQLVHEIGIEISAEMASAVARLA